MLLRALPLFLIRVLYHTSLGFTSMAKNVEPTAVMTFLNQLFTLFDQICDMHGVQKVETAGVEGLV